jgi:hypothetical protein
VLGLERLDLMHEGVVLGVRDSRRVTDVIGELMTANLLRQL